MLLIKKDGELLYVPGVSFNIFRNNSESVVETYDAHGKKLKQYTLNSHVEVDNA